MTTKTKQEIRERVDQLLEEARAAGAHAQNLEQSRQRAERARLYAECDAMGGHVYLQMVFGMGRWCGVCGYDKPDPGQQAANNLVKL